VAAEDAPVAEAPGDAVAAEEAPVAEVPDDTGGEPAAGAPGPADE
jgi:hypothetical protein